VSLFSVDGNAGFALGPIVVTPLVLALELPGTLVAGLLPVLMAVLLARELIGAMIIATFSVTVVMGQEYLPNRIGIASGVTLGLAIGVGGVAAAGLGVLADHTGLKTVMYVIAFTPLVAAAMALTLPRARTAAGAH
jgi:FSR family fosmidomycin resistance protein-like MFS transporter